MYRGNGAGGWPTGARQTVGSGWGPFTALLAPGDFSGDGKPDVLARTGRGALCMYRGDGDGGWLTGTARRSAPAGQPFTALLARRRLQRRRQARTSSRASPTARCCMYRGNGAGGWATGTAEPVGSGWGGVHRARRGRRLQRRRQGRRPRPPARRRAAALPRQRRRRLGHGHRRADRQRLERAELPDARAGLAAAGPAAPAPAAGARRRRRCRTATSSLTAGIRCTPPGGLLRVSVKVRRRAGRPAPRVQRILFFVRNGPRRTDRQRPYTVRLRHAPPRRPARPRLRAGLLPPRGLEDAAPQDRVAALRHVRLRRAGRSAPPARGGGSPAWRSGELGEDRGDVALDGAVGEEQPRGDRLVGAALGHLAEDGALALVELVERAAGRSVRPSRWATTSGSSAASPAATRRTASTNASPSVMRSLSR